VTEVEEAVDLRFVPAEFACEVGFAHTGFAHCLVQG
jgi:hypothetical protein